jgi:hypothetical protein
VCKDSQSLLSLRRPPYLQVLLLILLHPSSSNSWQFRCSPCQAIDYDPLPLQSTLEVYSLCRPLYLYHPLHLDSLHNCRLMNSTDYRLVRLRQHCDRCLCFLTNRYLTIKAAKGSKWY